MGDAIDISILITGDYCPIGRNKNIIDSNDYASLFGGFEKHTRAADLSITNLECPILESQGNKIAKSGPSIMATEKALHALTFAGFNLVTLANNHIMDYGPEGLKATMRACRQNGLDHVGAGRNLEEAQLPYVSSIRGKKVAFLNIAENEFCTTKGPEYGANPLNPISNHYQIKHAKSVADHVVVISHGGREHYPYPTPQLRERFRFFIDSGADLVVGHHTHCVSGMEQYQGKPIFYSLGNFIFDYKKKYQKGAWTQGIGVLFNFAGSHISYEVIPFHQGREKTSQLTLFNKKERILFLKKFHELSEVIISDDLFFQKWNDYIFSQKKTYSSLLMIQNRYVRELISRGWIPPMYFHSRKHRNVLLNLLRCETHREIMVDVLENDMRKASPAR